MRAGDIVWVGLVGMPMAEVLVGRAVLGGQEAVEATEPTDKPVLSMHPSQTKRRMHISQAGHTVQTLYDVKHKLPAAR